MGNYFPDWPGCRRRYLQCKKHQCGSVGFAMAMLLGTLSGLPIKEVYGSFNTKIFLQMLGMQVLIVVARNNGTMNILANAVMKLTKMESCPPAAIVLYFLMGLCQLVQSGHQHGSDPHGICSLLLRWASKPSDSRLQYNVYADELGHLPLLHAGLNLAILRSGAGLHPEPLGRRLYHGHHRQHHVLRHVLYFGLAQDAAHRPGRQ